MTMQPVAATASTMRTIDARIMPLLTIAVASGFAGLGYQIVWTQQGALWLGHEAPAVLAVLAAFFGGIATGSVVLAERIDRSIVPARWYAACELIIAAWSLALAALVPAVAPLLARFIGPTPSATWHAFVTFAGTFVLLAPATIAMGGTLPALERLTNIERAQLRIALVYAGNTLGAVIGVLATALWLLPMMGLRRTAFMCALLNVACAICALRLPKLDSAKASSSLIIRSDLRGLLALLALTGFLGLAYEVVLIRVLSQVAENTVYTFAIALAVYLLGTTTGAALYARLAAKKSPPREVLGQLLVFACLISMAGLTFAESIRTQVMNAIGMTMTAALCAEALIAAVAFLLPTIAMGALFSSLSAEARERGATLGRTLAWNTFGAALAPIVFGLFLVPGLGTSACVVLISAGYMLLTRGESWRAPLQWSAAAAIVLVAAWSPSLAFLDIPDAGRVVSRVEGVMATVSVIEDDVGVARLHINNRQQEGSSATLYADARQALLPLLLHPAPQRALFLGMGTGVTASSATLDPAVNIDVVELLPEVIDASSHFISSLDGIDRRRIHVTAADARRFVRATHASYDLIVADNFHPARSGSGTLYTIEHFEAVRDRLAPRGLFCQWLPLHQLDIESFRSVSRTFLQAFPSAYAVLATNSLDTPVIGLVGSRESLQLDLSSIRRRLSSVDSVKQFGFEDELAVLGSLVSDSIALRAFSAGASVNTDDHAIVVYRAPRLTYAPDSTPRDRLLALVEQLDLRSAPFAAAMSDRDRTRLQAYWSARNQFLAAGRIIRPTSDVHTMLAQVREPLLHVLKVSPDFRPAYDPLLHMTQVLASQRPDEARELLHELASVAPNRAEANELLHTSPGP